MMMDNTYRIQNSGPKNIESHPFFNLTKSADQPQVLPLHGPATSCGNELQWLFLVPLKGG